MHTLLRAFFFFLSATICRSASPSIFLPSPCSLIIIPSWSSRSFNNAERESRKELYQLIAVGFFTHIPFCYWPLTHMHTKSQALDPPLPTFFSPMLAELQLLSQILTECFPHHTQKNGGSSAAGVVNLDFGATYSNSSSWRRGTGPYRCSSNAARYSVKLLCS